MYKTRETGNLRDKLVLEIRISNDYHLEFLEYFKKDNIKQGILETELNQIILTNKVINALEDISNELPDKFIEFIKSKVTGLGESHIREALKNIEYCDENLLILIYKNIQVIF